MIEPRFPENEKERLASLRALGLVDTPPEERFDAIVRLASQVFEAPIAYISLVDDEHQFFKAKVGLGDSCETSRGKSFCGHAILEEEALVIPDTHADPRFSDNPMVTGEPFTRFYAGQPLRSKEGYNVATLCLMDARPREFSEHDRAVLRQLGRLAERELQMGNLIRLQEDLLATKDALIAAQEKVARQLDEALAYVISLLPPEMDEKVRAHYRFVPSSTLGGDAFGFHWIDGERLAVYLLDVCGHGVGSALLSVTAMNTLRTAALPGVDFQSPGAVLAAMNRAFPMEEHNGLFFTLWYGVVDCGADRIRYAGAGHPPAVVRDVAGGLRTLETGGPPVGTVAEPVYAEHEALFPEGSKLYVFSDGIFEVPVREGRMGTYADFLSDLRQDPLPADLVEHVRSRMDADEFPDDVSILRVAR